ncbi:hypothetical protein OG921_04760 [Aldersonia sp. NBC_00410]|uniref:hypothetical protein n=1 Tax=Aldersonia sp. NBC_00410 TaxID=2975954 RepID=UPI0022586A8B|nr:hypothetical protein [Aldersonia sp. NBC_00410]MCX5042483.1 hypothetical protein [Aldersonia sp. NBC_00410]
MSEELTGARKRAPAVVARERARKVVAEKRAAELAREKAIEDALAIVLLAEDSERMAAAQRDEKISAAHAAYRQAVSDLNRRSGEALCAMKTLNESVTSMVGMTGLQRAKITELMKCAIRPGEQSSESVSTAAAPTVVGGDGEVDLPNAGVETAAAAGVAQVLQQG